LADARRAGAVLLVLLCGCSSWLAESQSKSLVPCDKHDHAAQLDLAANAQRSKIERDACAGDRTCIERVLAERDAYVFRRCALPEGGR
jgi:hypothetical protein